MSHTILDRAIRAAGWSLFGLAVAGPLLGLTVDVVRAGYAPREGWALSQRQWMLLGKSVVLAGCAGVGSLILAIPGAMVISGRRGWGGPVLMTLLVSPLLFPATVTAFGWDRLTRADTWLGAAIRLGGRDFLSQGPARTVWVWSCWLWPVGALLLSLGWRRMGRAAYELAILDGSRAAALVYGVLPVMRTFIVASWVVVFAVCMTDYQVPHACGELVYATELISWVTETGRGVDVAWPSLPLVFLVVAVVAGALGWVRRDADSLGLEITGRLSVGSGTAAALVAVVFLTTLLPVGALAFSRDLGSAMGRAWSVYGDELGDSLGVAAIAMMGSILMAEALCGRGAAAKAASVMTLVAGALPGALVGQSLVATYIKVPLVYDHWPVMALTFLARFGWVGIVAGWLGQWSLPEHILEQAQVDGASEAQTRWLIRLPLTWPVMAAGGAVFAAMAMAEVPAISLTRVPGIGNVALSLIENFHRFEDDMLVSLSLWISAAVVPAVVLVMAALARRKTAVG